MLVVTSGVKQEISGMDKEMAEIQTQMASLKKVSCFSITHCCNAACI